MTSRDDDTPRPPGTPKPGGDEHWDELDAVRRFPSEDEWLDLPMPSDADLRGDEEPVQNGGSFADRVLRARQEEVHVDEALAALDRALPAHVLRKHRAPEPSATFVEETVRRIREDRRQRWAETLSRYVAPEPSPQFVDRTLAALRQDRAQRDSAGAAAARPGPRLSSSAPVWGLLSAAAAALLYVALADRSAAPLELHIADRVATSVSYVDATTPMAAVFAAVTRDQEPHALFDAPADGLWLYGQSGELR
ncbi:MAG: hypothetical protein ACON4Z_06085 [Planctomycetota bacterium]